MVYNWVRASGDGQEKASETAERFLTMIPDPVKRIYFAEKFQNYDVAIDVRSSLEGKSRFYFYYIRLIFRPLLIMFVTDHN